MKVVVVHRSAVIDAPIERVWAVLRDFGSHLQWHPAVTHSHLENDTGGDVVGSVRRLRFEDGTELREQLLQHSDRNHTCTCSILDASLPLFDQVTRLCLKPVTDGNQTFWQCQFRFRTPAHRAPELTEWVGRQVCEAGITGMRRYLDSKERSPGQPARGPVVEPAVATRGESLLTEAIQVTVAGDPEVMQLVEVEVAPPGPGEVRIRQCLAAVSEGDLAFRRGTVMGLDLPGTPGLEAVGRIMDVGPGVHGLFPEDRVAYLSRQPGAYTGLRCIDADACIPLPDDLSDEDASLLREGLTAGMLLTRVFRAVPGASILIQAVSDALGHLLSQWAHAMELTVVGTVSTPDQARFSRDHGCHHPILFESESMLVSEVMRITNGRGVEYGVYHPSHLGLDTALSCLSTGGHCAVVGDWGPQPLLLNLNALQQRSLSVSTPVCFDYIEQPGYLQRIAHQLFSRIRNRTVIPAIETFPLRRAAEVHQRMEERRILGAVALSIN